MSSDRPEFGQPLLPREPGRRSSMVRASFFWGDEALTHGHDHPMYHHRFWWLFSRGTPVDG